MKYPTIILNGKPYDFTGRANDDDKKESDNETDAVVPRPSETDCRTFVFPGSGKRPATQICAPENESIIVEFCANIIRAGGAFTFPPAFGRAAFIKKIKEQIIRENKE